MHIKFIMVLSLLLLYGNSALSQSVKQSFPLKSIQGLEPVHVSLAAEAYLGKQSVRIADTAKGISSELKYAKLKEINFQNGVIEVELAGKPLSTAVESARGFVGIAFRISEDNTK